MSQAPGGGPIDGSVLARLSQNALDHPLVTAATLEPNPDSPTGLRVSIDPTQYPATIETIRVDVRWFETGDFTFHYVEGHTDRSTWQCRWDRHLNPHSARAHFHEPPESPEATTIRDLPVEDPHPIAMLHLVLDWIEGCIERLWE